MKILSYKVFKYIGHVTHGGTIIHDTTKYSNVEDYLLKLKEVQKHEFK